MTLIGRKLTEVTRRKLFDLLGGTLWAGDLDETEFLGRLYDLSAMPSTDRRFTDAAGDIWQHRVRNLTDWDDDWVFTDSRFELRDGGDERVLDFLAEMLHPLVRRDEGEIADLLKSFNDTLEPDGYELYPADWISGHAVYKWRERTSFHGAAPDLKLDERHVLTDPTVLEEHLRRIRDGLTTDSPAAISSCKNLLESLFTIILDGSGIDHGPSDDLPKLYRKVSELLRLNAESVPDSAKGSQTSQKILRTLVTTVSSLAELRNELGIGHGRSTRSTALARHARLALNATVAVTEFVLDTWQARQPMEGGNPTPALQRDVDGAETLEA